MTTYVALLYSVVIDRQRRVAMADLRGIAETLGYNKPRTLVSTGNMIFEAEERPVAHVEAALEQAFAAFHGKYVHIIVRTAADFQKLVAANPFAEESAANGDQVCVRVMREPAKDALSAFFAPYQTQGEKIRIVDGDVWIAFAGKPSLSKLLARISPNRMGGVGTARNWNTIKRLGDMLDD